MPGGYSRRRFLQLPSGHAAAAFRENAEAVPWRPTCAHPGNANVGPQGFNDPVLPETTVNGISGALGGIGSRHAEYARNGSERRSRSTFVSQRAGPKRKAIIPRTGSAGSSDLAEMAPVHLPGLDALHRKRPHAGRRRITFIT